jgi:hypothetical protein
MPRFEKGSEEAKEYMRKLRESRKKTSPGEPRPPRKPREKKTEDETYVQLPTFSGSELTIPEFFVVEKKQSDGTIAYQLANPLTKSRNLASRQKTPSIRIIRKPVSNMIWLSHLPDTPIPLSLFSAKDRIKIKESFDLVEQYKDYKMQDIPISEFDNKTRGRPELLAKNVAINVSNKTAPPIRSDEDKLYDGGYDESVVDYTQKTIDKYKKQRGIDKILLKKDKEKQTMAEQKKASKKSKSTPKEEVIEETKEEIQPEEPKKRIKASKYETDEQRKEALRIQKRDYMRRKAQ